MAVMAVIGIYTALMLCCISITSGKAMIEIKNNISSNSNTNNIRPGNNLVQHHISGLNSPDVGLADYIVIPAGDITSVDMKQVHKRSVEPTGRSRRRNRTASNRKNKNASRRSKKACKSDKVFHLVLDTSQSGFPGNPKFKSNSSENEHDLLPIPYWTYTSVNKKNNLCQNFATINDVNGTITLQRDGVYLVYSSVAVEETGNGNHLIEAENRTILKCNRPEQYPYQTQDGFLKNNPINDYNIKVCKTVATVPLMTGQTLSMWRDGRNNLISDKHLNYWGVVEL